METPTRPATSAEAAELRHLVGLVYLQDGPEVVAECLAVALADVDRALRCYRHLAGLYGFDTDPETPAPAPAKDTRPRVTCATCEHFQPWPGNPTAALGRCGAGRVPGLAEPALWPNVPRRCPQHHSRTES